MVQQVTDYIATLAPIAPATDVDALPGATLFETLGCTACHTPTLGEGADAIQLYSDLLIHDLGGPLDDGFVQGSAEGRHWRTTPLWGLRYRERFLHDGRTTDLERAILEHGGTADPSIARFEDLTETDRETLYDFLLQL